jgi:hypothetical protein
VQPSVDLSYRMGQAYGKYRVVGADSCRIVCHLGPFVIRYLEKAGPRLGNQLLSVLSRCFPRSALNQRRALMLARVARISPLLRRQGKLGFWSQECSLVCLADRQLFSRVIWARIMNLVAGPFILSGGYFHS